MDKEKMWVYMIQLGSNMWCKPGQRTGFAEKEHEYHDFLQTEKDIWRKVTDFLPKCGFNTLLIDIGEGIKLDSHPELAVSGSWDKEEIRQELKRLREIGLTPIPKYNFSCAHNAWMKEYSYMVGTDTYYQVCKDIIEETIEIFDTPEFFHLGLEEEDYAGGQRHFPIATIRAPYKLLEDANALFRVCLDKGVRPWIWAEKKSVEGFGGEEGFKNNIPKEVLISNWAYLNFTDPYAAEKIKYYNKFDEWGYEQIPTFSTFYFRGNARQTMRYCKEAIKEENVRGYCAAPWQRTTELCIYSLLDEAWRFKDAKKLIYPEEK